MADKKIAQVHVLGADTDDPTSALAYLAERLDKQPKVIGVLVAFICEDDVGWACFGKVSKPDTAYLAAHLQHAVTCFCPHEE